MIANAGADKCFFRLWCVGAIALTGIIAATTGFIAFAVFEICRLVPGNWINSKKMMLVITLVLGFVLFGYTEIINSHSDSAVGWTHLYRSRKIRDTNWIINERSSLKENDVIIDCPEFEHVDGMFFLNNTCYGYLNNIQRQQLLNQKKHLIEFGS